MAKKKKKTARKTKTKTKAKTKAKTKKATRRAKGRYSFVDEVYEGILDSAEISPSGILRLKKADVKRIVEGAFEDGARKAAAGERIRFPIIGALVRKDVKARKAGKGTNPFTGEPMTIRARPASKKPRWSFPKSVKETFASKRNW